MLRGMPSLEGAERGTFRPAPSVSQIAQTPIKYLASIAQAQFSKSADRLSVALLYETGPQGAVSPVATAVENAARENGMTVSMTSYVLGQQDLRSSMSQLLNGRPDVLIHVPITARPSFTSEWQNLPTFGSVKAVIWLGPLHDPVSLAEHIRGPSFYVVHGATPQPIVEAAPADLKTLATELTRRYGQERPEKILSSDGLQAFSHTWVLLDSVIPRALQYAGGRQLTSDHLVRAAQELDLRAGRTLLEYGVQFYPSSSALAGQNERAGWPLYRYTSQRAELVYPALSSLGRSFAVSKPQPARIASSSGSGKDEPDPQPPSEPSRPRRDPPGSPVATPAAGGGGLFRPAERLDSCQCALQAADHGKPFLLFPWIRLTPSSNQPLPGLELKAWLAFHHRRVLALARRLSTTPELPPKGSCSS